MNRYPWPAFAGFNGVKIIFLYLKFPEEIPNEKNWGRKELGSSLDYYNIACKGGRMGLKIEASLGDVHK